MPAIAATVVVVLATIVGSSPAGADDPTIHAFDTADSPFGDGPNQGWWSPTTSNGSANSTYLSGTLRSVQRRGFMTFDLSSLGGLEGSVVAARLELTVGRALFTDPHEALGVWDVSTDAATLNGGGMSAAIFDDLGGGTSLGTVVVDTSMPEDGVIGVEFDADGLAAVDSARGGWFSVGLSLLDDDGNDSLFLGTGAAGIHRLVVEFTPAADEGPPGFERRPAHAGIPDHAARPDHAGVPDHAVAKGHRR